MKWGAAFSIKVKERKDKVFLALRNKLCSLSLRQAQRPDSNQKTMQHPVVELVETTAHLYLLHLTLGQQEQLTALEGRNS